MALVECSGCESKHPSMEWGMVGPPLYLSAGREGVQTCPQRGAPLQGAAGVAVSLASLAPHLLSKASAGALRKAAGHALPCTTSHYV